MEPSPPVRSRSRVDVFIHFVWATKRRQQWLSPELEGPIYRCLAQEAQRFDCRVLAIGGTSDHLHVLVGLNAKTTIGQLCKAMKGVSSAMARDLTDGDADGWQDNYAAFSVSRQHLKRVTAYIQNQKTHHAMGDLWASVENLDFEQSNQ